jgi:hypothetical protein
MRDLVAFVHRNFAIHSDVQIDIEIQTQSRAPRERASSRRPLLFQTKAPGWIGFSEDDGKTIAAKPPIFLTVLRTTRST